MWFVVWIKQLLIEKHGQTKGTMSFVLYNVFYFYRLQAANSIILKYLVKKRNKFISV